MIFMADPEKFERIEASEHEMETAEFLLYNMGRSIECGMDDQAGQLIRTLAEQNRELTIRAIAAAYLAVIESQDGRKTKKDIERIQNQIGSLTYEEAVTFSDFLTKLEKIRSRFQRRLDQCDPSDHEAVCKEKEVYRQEREALLREEKRRLKVPEK